MRTYTQPTPPTLSVTTGRNTVPIRPPRSGRNPRAEDLAREAAEALRLTRVLLLEADSPDVIERVATSELREPLVKAGQRLTCVGRDFARHRTDAGTLRFARRLESLGARVAALGLLIYAERLDEETGLENPPAMTSTVLLGDVDALIDGLERAGADWLQAQQEACHAA